MMPICAILNNNLFVVSVSIILKANEDEDQHQDNKPNSQKSTTLSFLPVIAAGDWRSPPVIDGYNTII
jgi:hypothetical protein